jgi:peptidoglycan/xylan/chitin deacetylase (PgdA/CDA1 family)
MPATLALHRERAVHGGPRPAGPRSRRTLRKDAKLLLLHVARSLGAFALARRLSGRGVRILCYHGTWRGPDAYPGDSLLMRGETFVARLDALHRLGYPVVPLARAVAALEGRTTLSSAAVVITIDDGWYGTYAEMLPALRERGLPATLYCDTAQLRSGLPHLGLTPIYLRRLAPPERWCPAAERAFALATAPEADPGLRLAALQDLAIALGIEIAPYLANRVFHYMTPAELAEAAASGLDVQLHTHRHTLHDLSPEEVAREIAENRAALAEILGGEPGRFSHFAYPKGVCNAGAATALERLGIASSTTTEQRVARRGMRRQLLPRLLDGEQLTGIEFEAELSGFGDLLRGLRRLLWAWPCGAAVQAASRLSRRWALAAGAAR